VPPKACVAGQGWERKEGVLIILSSLCSDLREMAPVPISNMKPIVKITKNSTATQNPKLLIELRVTDKGSKRTSSKSNTKNNILIK